MTTQSSIAAPGGGTGTLLRPAPGRPSPRRAPVRRPLRGRKGLRGGLAAAAGLVLTLAAALPAEAQASRTRPETGRSGGTATRSSPPPSAPSTSSAPRSSASGSGPAARTRPAGPGSGGRTVITEDRRGPRGSRRVFIGGYYPFGIGWWGYYPSRWGYGGWYGGYGPWYGPGPYGARWYGERVREDMGALDLDLKPGDTKIYLDGQYVGTADRFDGWPQYLWLEEGTYQLVFYREGRETIAREYRIHPGLVIDVEDRLARGQATPPEELFVARPAPTPRRDARVRRNEERRREAEQEPADWRQRAERERERPEYAEPDPGAAFGSLRLTVSPADASVYLDGRFIGTGEELARLRGGLTVEAGEHVLAVVRPGHAPEEVELAVEAGEVVELDVELETVGTL